MRSVTTRAISVRGHGRGGDLMTRPTQRRVLVAHYKEEPARIIMRIVARRALQLPVVIEAHLRR